LLNLSIFGLCAVAIFTSVNARAADLPNLKSAVYTESSWIAGNMSGQANLIDQSAELDKAVERFSISKDGTKIVFRDLKENISYPLDLNQTKEQDLPEAYLTLLAKNPLNGGIGKIIRRISISDIKQASKNEIRANVNIYIAYRSIFGGINTKITVQSHVANANCDQYVQTQNAKGESYFGTKSKPCLKVAAATSAELTELSSDIPAIYENLKGFGAIADLAVRLLAPTFTRATQLFEI
jgi:hypothetical protein